MSFRQALELHADWTIGEEAGKTSLSFIRDWLPSQTPGSLQVGLYRSSHGEPPLPHRRSGDFPKTVLPDMLILKHCTFRRQCTARAYSLGFSGG